MAFYSYDYLLLSDLDCIKREMYINKIDLVLCVGGSYGRSTHHRAYSTENTFESAIYTENDSLISKTSISTRECPFCSPDILLNVCISLIYTLQCVYLKNKLPPDMMTTREVHRWPRHCAYWTCGHLQWLCKQSVDRCGV